jgi:hypothetical protein
MSASSSAAPSLPRRTSSAASWLFTAIAERLRPMTSCRSRAKRSRSSATASCACTPRLRSISRTTSRIQTLKRKAVTKNPTATPIEAPTTTAAAGGPPSAASPPASTPVTAAPATSGRVGTVTDSASSTAAPATPVTHGPAGPGASP